MKTASRAAPKSREGRPSAPAPVAIDYPQRQDVILSSSYSFRIAADPELTHVEVSIDEGPWQACRRSVGYWWYDWSGFAPGRHQLLARGRGPAGRIAVTAPRQFDVASTQTNCAGS